HYLSYGYSRGLEVCRFRLLWQWFGCPQPDGCNRFPAEAFPGGGMPRRGGQTGMGWERKSFRLRKKPLCGVNPLRNNPHKSEHPICARAELMYKSCLPIASATEQLGTLSVSS